MKNKFLLNALLMSMATMSLTTTAEAGFMDYIWGSKKPVSVKTEKSPEVKEISLESKKVSWKEYLLGSGNSSIKTEKKDVKKTSLTSKKELDEKEKTATESYTKAVIRKVLETYYNGIFMDPAGKIFENIAEGGMNAFYEYTNSWTHKMMILMLSPAAKQLGYEFGTEVSIIPAKILTEGTLVAAEEILKKYNGDKDASVIAKPLTASFWKAIKEVTPSATSGIEVFLKLNARFAFRKIGLNDLAYNTLDYVSYNTLFFATGGNVPLAWALNKAVSPFKTKIVNDYMPKISANYVVKGASYAVKSLYKYIFSSKKVEDKKIDDEKIDTLNKSVVSCKPKKDDKDDKDFSGGKKYWALEIEKKDLPEIRLNQVKKIFSEGSNKNVAPKIINSFNPPISASAA